MQINLRKKPTFNELINYLEVKQPKIRYPDRTATFLRNSHYMSQFDGNLFDMEEQKNRKGTNKRNGNKNHCSKPAGNRIIIKK